MMAREAVIAELARIDQKDAGAPRKKVAVLGAGMAGLAAAYELSRLGHSVQLIEATGRIGGRVVTKRFDNGDHHELGAMRIPKVHHHTRHYIDKFGLKLRRFVNHHQQPRSFYAFRGERATHTDYGRTLLPKFAISDREMGILKGGENPAVALLSVFAHGIELVKSDTRHIDALFGRGPMTDVVARLDSQTLGDYLREHLDTEEAVVLAGVASGLEVWMDKAASMFIREEIALEDNEGHFDEIVGGMDRLPRAFGDALAKRTNVTLQLETWVRAIHSQRHSVQLVLASRGGTTTQRVDADYVICTIPFGVLRGIELSGLSSGKMRAIRNLHYASSSKVLFSCKRRFWETDYGIFGGGSQTDLISRQIYYPSDSGPSTTTVAEGSLAGLHTSFALDVAQPPSAPERSGALVGSYAWGADARRLGALCKEERARIVRACVAEIHPEILEDGMVLDDASVFWDEEDSAAGAFCFLRPGDLQHHYRDAIRPEGRCYFAGEHCSMDQAWIQGALSSALSAVGAIVEQRT